MLIYTYISEDGEKSTCASSLCRPKPALGYLVMVLTCFGNYMRKRHQAASALISRVIEVAGANAPRRADAPVPDAGMFLAALMPALAAGHAEELRLGSASGGDIPSALCTGRNTTGSCRFSGSGRCAPQEPRCRAAAAVRAWPRAAAMPRFCGSSRYAVCLWAGSVRSPSPHRMAFMVVSLTAAPDAAEEPPGGRSRISPGTIGRHVPETDAGCPAAGRKAQAHPHRCPL